MEKYGGGVDKEPDFTSEERAGVWLGAMEETAAGLDDSDEDGRIGDFFAFCQGGQGGMPPRSTRGNEVAL
jgi:hypothetical protein